jgi:ATPase subunit of ABC transporter with duplicated ATPase domains
MTALDAFREAYDGHDVEFLRKTAATFLLTGKELANKVGDLSEGQKGLLMFAYLTLQKPGILNSRRADKPHQLPPYSELSKKR